MKAIYLNQAYLLTVDFLLDSFNSKVKSVIDDIAPVKVRKNSGRQKAPWRDSTAMQNMKRQCRRTERMWRNTKLEVQHLQRQNPCF